MGMNAQAGVPDERRAASATGGTMFGCAPVRQSVDEARLHPNHTAMTVHFRPVVRMPVRVAGCTVLTPLVALALTAGALQGQQPARSAGAVPVGFAPSSIARQAAAESIALRLPTAASSRAHSRVLSAVPHVAGTPAQARTRDYVLRQMQSWGLDTATRAYTVYLPHATSVRAWRLSPVPVELALAEPPVRGDPQSAMRQYPTVNGYSAAGDAQGEIVYVNYGLIEDYRQLDSMGVSVKGRIAVARYGRSYRGIKAREAEKRGALALFIYSDPADDGYVRGDVYPEGPMRNSRGVQRGSIKNANGDPSTPGAPSTAGARRLPVDSMDIPRIPVVPISYGNATMLLAGVRGAAVPQSWQGGLAFRYHAGPGPVRARVRVTTDTGRAAYKPIWNTLATIRGSDLPDEVVIIGAHRDAWNAGSGDNVSGTVSTLEAARVFGELLRQGIRPRRTVVFATWDAEEWGLVGSTEFVEDDSLRLLRGGVAYLNQDVAAQGVQFGGGGSPSLRALLRAVAAQVPDPNGRGTVYEEWRRRAAVADTAEPSMGDPGGGSDFAGFYNHLGIPHADWGFGGAGGIYHSAYDTPAWMERFGDTSYSYHAAAGRIGSVMLLRLANATVLPYDYSEFARAMQRPLADFEKALDGQRWDRSAAAPLRTAIDRFAAAAASFASARDGALAAGLTNERATRVNAALLLVERRLTRAEGLRTRPWFRNLIYAADENNGYSTMVWPSVNEALRRADRALTVAEALDLATRFGAAASALDEARAALR